MDLMHALGAHLTDDDEFMLLLEDFELGPLRSDDALQRRIEIQTGIQAAFNDKHPSLCCESLKLDPNLIWKSSAVPEAGRALVSNLKKVHSNKDVEKAISDFAVRANFVTDATSFVRGFFTLLAPRRPAFVATYAKVFTTKTSGKFGQERHLFDHRFLSDAFGVLQATHDRDMDDNDAHDVNELADALIPYADAEMEFELFMTLTTSSEEWKEQMMRRLVENGKDRQLSESGKVRTVLWNCVQHIANIASASLRNRWFYCQP